MIGQFVKGLVTGAIVGGAVALFNNPNRGDENREILKDYLDDLEASARDLQGSIAHTENAVMDLAHQGLSATKAVRDDLTLAIRDFKNSAVPHLNTIQEKTAQLEAQVNDAQVTFKTNKK